MKKRQKSKIIQPTSRPTTKSTATPKMSSSQRLTKVNFDQDDDASLSPSPLTTSRPTTKSTATPKTSSSQRLTKVNFDQDDDASLSPSPFTTSRLTPKKSSYNLVKSSISISKINNELIYAVVFWILESKFSLVSCCQIHPKRDQKIEVGLVYETSFGNCKYPACVKYIGSKNKCQEVLKTILCENDSLSVRSNFTLKTPNQENKKKNHVLDFENVRLKQKLVEMSELLEKKDHKINELEVKLLKAEETIKFQKETFNPADFQKIMKMSKIFIDIYGSNDDCNLSQKCLLSEKYPQIIVSQSDKIQIEDEINKCGEKQGSWTFRKVILILLPDRKEWVSRTMREMMKDFSDQINVAFELVKVKDPTFDLCLAKGRINQIIQDSKKKHHKLEKH